MEGFVKILGLFIRVYPLSSDQLDNAVAILKQGGLVAIPTETVYGLGADATNPAALQKIFSAKKRPEHHPLIVHLGDIAWLSHWARDISEDALKLAEAFWPGPLTLILKKAPHVSDIITGGQDTIGLRIPEHLIALELLKKFGNGIAAPSANRFGRISPTTANAVYEELGDAVDLILDGGPCKVGVESTIVDVSGDEPVILRPGMISSDQIENVLQKKLSTPKKNAPRVSGSLDSHYAPETKVILMEQAEIFSFAEGKNSVAVLTRTPEMFNDNYCVTSMPEKAEQYAQNLYQALRELDKKKFSCILVENVPDQSEWQAIRDRLKRASNQA